MDNCRIYNGFRICGPWQVEIDLKLTISRKLIYIAMEIEKQRTNLFIKEDVGNEYAFFIPFRTQGKLAIC